MTNDFVKWNWYFLLYFHAHFLLNCHNHFFVYSTFVLRNIFAFFSCLIFCWRKLTVGQQKIYDKSLTRKSNVCLHHANVFFQFIYKAEYITTARTIIIRFRFYIAMITCIIKVHRRQRVVWKLMFGLMGSKANIDVPNLQKPRSNSNWEPFSNCAMLTCIATVGWSGKCYCHILNLNEILSSHGPLLVITYNL